MWKLLWPISHPLHISCIAYGRALYIEHILLANVSSAAEHSDCEPFLQSLPLGENDDKSQDTKRNTASRCWGLQYLGFIAFMLWNRDELLYSLTRTSNCRPNLKSLLPRVTRKSKRESWWESLKLHISITIKLLCHLDIYLAFHVTMVKTSIFWIIFEAFGGSLFF